MLMLLFSENLIKNAPNEANLQTFLQLTSVTNGGYIPYPLHWWSFPAVVNFNQGDFTWSSLSGRSVRLTPVDIQSLSELERARLQEVAYTRLHQDYDLGCQITMPKGERTHAL